MQRKTGSRLFSDRVGNMCCRRLAAAVLSRLSVSFGEWLASSSATSVPSASMFNASSSRDNGVQSENVSIRSPPAIYPPSSLFHSFSNFDPSAISHSEPRLFPASVAGTLARAVLGLAECAKHVAG